MGYSCASVKGNSKVVVGIGGRPLKPQLIEYAAPF